MNKFVKILLSAWILFIGINNLIWYFGNTFLMISALKFGIFIILTTMAGWVWLLVVPSCWYACIGLFIILWSDSKRLSIWAYILIPLILVILIKSLGKGLFPMVVDETTREIYIRMFPLVGK